MKPTVALLILSILFGCHHQIRVNDQVQRQTYAYRKLNEGTFLVAAIDGLALTFALAELGCSKKMICSVQPNGQQYIVEITKK